MDFKCILVGNLLVAYGAVRRSLVVTVVSFESYKAIGASRVARMDTLLLFWVGLHNQSYATVSNIKHHMYSVAPSLRKIQKKTIPTETLIAMATTYRGFAVPEVPSVWKDKTILLLPFPLKFVYLWFELKFTL